MTKRVQVNTVTGSVHHYEVDVLTGWSVYEGILHLRRGSKVIAIFAAGLWINVEEVPHASAA